MYVYDDWTPEELNTWGMSERRGYKVKDLYLYIYMGYIYTYIHKYVYTYMCIYIQVHICVCVCVYHDWTPEELNTWGMSERRGYKVKGI